MKFATRICAIVATMAMAAGAVPALADSVVENLTEPGYASLKGKRIVYIPIAMNYDITRAWYLGMKREADRLGYEIIVKDPNWDTNAAVQAFQAAIREKPDLIVTLPPDVTSLARLVRKAQEDGIPVIEINQITSTPPDVFVGTDWIDIGRSNAQSAIEACSTTSGKSGKIALVTGPTNAAASIAWVQGVTETLEGRDDMTIVSTQAANWDASRSHDIAATVLQQHADLCGILDVWDGDATGTAAAVREAGRTGQVFVATAGGGESTSCQAVETGGYTSYVSFNSGNQASYVNAVVKMLLQAETRSDKPMVVLTPNNVLTKDNLLPSSCWTYDQLEKTGG